MPLQNIKLFCDFIPPRGDYVLLNFKIEYYLLKSFMMLGVMRGFIFLPPKINIFEKVSDFDLSRGYLIGMVKIFFEIFFCKKA